MLVDTQIFLKGLTVADLLVTRIPYPNQAFSLNWQDPGQHDQVSCAFHPSPWAPVQGLPQYYCWWSYR